MEGLDNFTKALQSDTVSIAEENSIFDKVITNFPCTKRRLSLDAEILHNPSFEAAVAKIKSGRSLYISIEESSRVFHFKKFENSANEEDDQIGFSLATLVLK